MPLIILIFSTDEIRHQEDKLTKTQLRICNLENVQNSGQIFKKGYQERKQIFCMRRRNWFG